MKVKPYRICDICGEEYEKTHGCMSIKVKRFYDIYGFCDMYGDLKIMSTMDICPECGYLMIDWILNRRMLKEAVDGPGGICSD